MATMTSGKRRGAMAGACSGRKGIAFALSALMLGIVALMLASMLAEQSSRTRQAAVRMAELDNAAEFFNNAQRQAAKIIAGNSHMLVMPDPNTSINATYLTITETLPVSPYFAGELESYANITANLSPYNLSVNFSGFGNGTYFIRPGEGNMTHPDGQMLLVPDATQAEKLGGYVIDIVYLTGFPGNMQWETQAAGGPNDNMSVTARAHDSTFTVNHILNATISKSSPSAINITDGTGALIGLVSFGSPFGGKGAVLVDYLGGNITLKTSANFTQPLYVEANATITLVSGVFNRTSLIRVG